MGPERYALLAGCDFTLLPSRRGRTRNSISFLRMSSHGAFGQTVGKLQVGALRPRADGGRTPSPEDQSGCSSLAQCQAMRMGTLPIVAPTGGLKDTVEARLAFFT